MNVVLAAHRADHPEHAPVRAWFDAMLRGDERFAVPAFLATNRRIFPVPTPRAEAFSFIDATRAQPLHLEIAPGPRHFELLREICDAADATGNLVPDAVIAAVAVEHGCEVVTLDRDFGRFSTVRHRRP